MIVSLVSPYLEPSKPYLEKTFAQKWHGFWDRVKINFMTLIVGIKFSLISTTWLSLPLSLYGMLIIDIMCL